MPVVRFVLTLLVLCAALPAVAQNYPAKSVRIVSPFPPGGSVHVVTLLNEHLKKVLTAPDQAKLWQERGLDVIASSPEAFAAHIESEQKKWGRVIRERGIKAE